MRLGILFCTMCLALLTAGTDAYAYTGDRLASMTRSGIGTVSFTHDVLGRMTADGHSGTSIEYNHLDLPRKIIGNGGISVDYSYLSDGSKSKAERSDGTGLVYRGSLTYRKAANGSLTLEGADVPEGRLTPNGLRMYVTDHLGSVRAVVDGATGNLYTAKDYEAYGTSSMNATGSSYLTTAPTGETFRQGFTGQEDQGPDFSLPYTDYGARQYSPALRRWLVLDPMSEKYYGISPYVYCAGSPVNLVDPLGKDWYIFNLDGSYRTSIPMVGIPLMVIASEDMQICNFYFFADPINDPVSINQGDIIKVTIIPESIVRDLLEEQRTFNPEIDIIDFVKASSSLSTSSDYSFDYSSAVLAGMFGGTKEKGEIEIKSNRLFLPEGSRFAHNLMNFGNFLWGASGYTIGIPIPILLMGAHANSLGLFSRNSRSYSGYDPQFDSFDDQLSILEGAIFAKTNHYKDYRR